MVRFGMRRRRGVRRRRFRRRANPRRMLRKARLIRRAAGRKIQRKKERKNRKIKKNVWGYMDSSHKDAAYNTTAHWSPGRSQDVVGLGQRDDMDEIFQQVRQIDDLIYPNSAGADPQLKANRRNIDINVQGRATYIVSHNSNAGGIFAQIYICKPRHDIMVTGVGKSNDRAPAEIVANNLNSRSLADYNDGAGLSVASFGTTPAVNNVIVNTTTQAKPTVASTDHWVTPFMVPEFTRTYKVVKVHKVFIPPGGNYMFTIKLPLRRISRQDFEPNSNASQLTGGIQLLRKFAVVPYIRFHGEPGADKTTDTLVNYVSASLNCVVDKKYEFSYRSQPAYFTVRGTDGTGTVTTASKITENVVDEGELP